jgi:hypothetical protein
VFATLYPYLPETFTDWFICRISGHLNKEILKGSEQLAKEHKEKLTTEQQTGHKSE